MHDYNERYLICIDLFALFTFCLEINTIDRLIEVKLCDKIRIIKQNDKE